METRNRPTIQDGKVVTYARGFDERPGIIAKSCEATGPFEVSASRNAVVVHRAELRKVSDFDELIEALGMAWADHILINS